jgi:hypothetical protein
MTMTTLPNTGRNTSPSDKQLDLIAKLRAERGIDPTGDLPRDKWEASALIDDLFRTPRPRPTVDAEPARVADGRYALDDAAGALRFYRVNTPTEGRWAGYTFVDVMASDDRWPIRDKAQREAILAEIEADPMAALTRYGQEIGACGHCGRTLTDADSRARGIGPVCAARFA